MRKDSYWLCIFQELGGLKNGNRNHFVFSFCRRHAKTVDQDFAAPPGVLEILILKQSIVSFQILSKFPEAHNTETTLCRLDQIVNYPGFVKSKEGCWNWEDSRTMGLLICVRNLTVTIYQFFKYFVEYENMWHRTGVIYLNLMIAM